MIALYMKYEILFTEIFLNKSKKDSYLPFCMHIQLFLILNVVFSIDCSPLDKLHGCATLMVRTLL